MQEPQAVRNGEPMTVCTRSSTLPGALTDIIMGARDETRDFTPRHKHQRLQEMVSSSRQTRRPPGSRPSASRNEGWCLGIWLSYHVRRTAFCSREKTKSTHGRTTAARRRRRSATFLLRPRRRDHLRLLGFGTRHVLKFPSDAGVIVFVALTRV